MRHPSRVGGNRNRIVRDGERWWRRKALRRWRRVRYRGGRAALHGQLAYARGIQNPGKFTRSGRAAGRRRGTDRRFDLATGEMSIARDCRTGRKRRRWRRSPLRRLGRRRSRLIGRRQRSECLRPDAWPCSGWNAHRRVFHARGRRAGRLIQHLNQSRDAGSAAGRRALDRLRLRQRRGGKWIAARPRRLRRLRSMPIIKASC